MDDAYRYAGQVAERAAAADDRASELCARIKQGVGRMYAEPEGATEQLRALVDEALPVFEASGDDFGLFIARSRWHRLRICAPGWTHHGRRCERALIYARAARPSTSC